MSAAARRWWVGAAWLALACVPERRTDETPAQTSANGTSGTAPSSSTASSPAALGPPPSSAPEAERRAAVFELLAGGKRAAELPERATDPEQEFDLGLREKLSPAIIPPSVRHGAATTSDGLPREVVQRIVRQQSGRLRLCYQKALRAQPDLAGELVLEFRIDAQGRVQQLSSTGELGDSGKLGEAAFRHCVEDLVRPLAFPKPEGSKTVQVRYPITFAPAD